MAHLAASTLVALVAAGAAMCLRGRNGAWRHALLVAAILRFAVPTAWLVDGGAGFAAYAHAAYARSSGIPAVDRLADLLLFGNAELGGIRPHTAPASSDASLMPYLFLWAAVLWAAGAGVCLTLWVRGLFRRIPFVREATLQETAALSRARRAFDSRIGPELRIAGAAQAPGIRGVWGACIILPDGMSEQLSAAELESVLVHELAHAYRRDNLTAALAHLVGCVFWFYPVIWWLERRMVREREVACDEMVLARGADPAVYLSGLYKVCQMSFWPAQGYASAGGSNLKPRIEGILSYEHKRSSPPAGRLAAATLVALVLLFPVGGAFLKAQEPTAEQDQITVVSPSSAEGRIQAGMAMLGAGNFGGAEEAFRMALALEPGNGKAILGLVEALAKEGKTDQALEFLKKKNAGGGSRLDLRLAEGNLAVRAGKYDQALAVYQAVLDTLDPGSAAAGDVHMRMGETYRRTGKIDLAIEQLRLAKTLLPEKAAVVGTTLALCLDEAKRWAAAQEEYQAVLRIDPNNAVALNNLAYLLSQHGGDLDLAVEYAQRAVQLLPDLPEISDTLGTVYLIHGMTEEALGIFRRLLEASPATSGKLAERLAKAGQRDAVWAELTAALARHHSQTDDEAIAGILRKLR